MAVTYPVVLTAEGRRALEEQLRSLYTRRSAVVDEIAIARGETDLTESTAYLQARDEQGMVEGRITEIETILRRARDADLTGRSEVVRLGSRVRVEDDAGEVEYHLVDPFAVDPAHGRISTLSPVGRALLGARSGDRVTAQTPAGTRTLRVRRVR